MAAMRCGRMMDEGLRRAAMSERTAPTGAVYSGPMTIHLRSLRFDDERRRRDEFPFTVPSLRAIDELAFTAPVTLLVGENGTGKSTLVEALAVAAGSVAAAGEPLERDPSLTAARALADAMRLVWNKRTSRGFFMRAEDFFRYVRRVQQEAQDLQTMGEDFGDRFSGYGRQLAVGLARGQRHALTSRYGGDLDARSHGESFIAFFQARLVPGGLYVLDEPEAALSPQRQLTFLAMIRDMVERDCQFVVATHSPVLMAIPGAAIVSLDETPPRPVDFDDLEHVRFLREFLTAPERFLRHL